MMFLIFYYNKSIRSADYADFRRLMNLEKAEELNTKPQSHKNREEEIYFYLKKAFYPIGRSDF